MISVTCPFCGMQCHTSCPEMMIDCAYCGQPFAEVRTDYQRLVVLGRDADGVWDIAESLAERLQEEGDLESEVIVDRRLAAEPHAGGERRRHGALAGGIVR